MKVLGHTFTGRAVGVGLCRLQHLLVTSAHTRMSSLCGADVNVESAQRK